MRQFQDFMIPEKDLRHSKAVEEDVCGQSGFGPEEIQFVLDKGRIVDCFSRICLSGKISCRVTP